MKIALLQQLSEAFGPSGFEQEITEVIKGRLEDLGVDCHQDAMGNIIVKLPCDGQGNKRVVQVDAHMDEVGLMVQHIDSNGFLKVVTLGGIIPTTLVAKILKIKGAKGWSRGITSTVPPHLRNKKDEAPTIEGLWIDIGATSANQVRELGIRVGSPAVIDAQFIELSKNRVTGKAFDDRVGCMMLLELAEAYAKGGWKPKDTDLCLSFSVQEEVGMRGVRAAVREINPDLFIAVEGTICSDIPGVPEENYVTRLGKGPALTVMDNSVITPPYIADFAFSLADKLKIPYQIKTPAFGGTNSGAAHTMKNGIPSLTLATPCRYIHTQQSVLDPNDFDSGVRLLQALIEKSGEMLASKK